MTLVYEVSDALNSAGIKNLGHAYPYTIPPSSFARFNGQALIAISEVMEIPTEHGSNQYNELISQIQVKIGYPIGNQVNMDTFEQSIVSFFIDKNWLRLPNNGHYLDESGHAQMDLFFRRRI